MTTEQYIIRKYPRTPHLEGSRLQPGDEDLSQIPFDAINKGTGRKYQSEVYICRKDEQGKKLDKKAMLMTSKALAHNRIEIVANNYIRGL